MCSRRFPLFALSLFLALLLVPSRALAYDFIPKGLAYSADLDGSRYGAVAVAANQFDAACYALGKEPASISTSIRSKLSDPNYGGRFYDFSQAFYTQGWPLEEVPEWLPIYVWGSLEWSDLLLSDYQSVWYVTCTQSLRSGALADFLAVLNGEDLGGGDGGDSSVVDGYVAIPLDVNPRDSLPYGPWFLETFDGHSYSSYTSAPNPAYILIPSSSYSSLSNSFSTYDYCFACMERNPRVHNSVYFLFSDYADAMTYQDTAGTILSGCRLGAFRFKYRVDNTVVDSSGRLLVYTSFVSSGGQGPFSNFNPCVIYWKRFDGGFAAPVLPPAGTWPEPSSPAAPVEPTFPDPATPTVLPDPVVTEPTVTWPSPTITIDPAPVPGTTPTGLDYTELLTRINDNLISIDSFSRALNSNLNSLRSDLVNEFDGVVSGLRNVYTYLQHMDGVLERHCIHLQNKMEDVSVDMQNKMRELVHWLAEQLDFDSESSGNSDLFGILSTISDKLGGGTYEPNPLKDENAYYEWLDDLWDRFLLGDNWQSSASSMSQSFGQLTSRFPFSVPWDIVALFRLFVHDPVTPVFDLPLYYSSEDSATVRVDLSAWDGVASVVRPLVFVIFALKLALLSRHLLAGFGADKGGL